MQNSLDIISVDSNKKQVIKTQKNYEKEFRDCLDYIDSYWNKIIHNPAKEKVHSNFLNVPYRFITPNDKKFTHIFYWDLFLRLLPNIFDIFFL